MEKIVKDKQDIKENEFQEQLSVWKKPVIMRIELKRTLEGAGSGADFNCTSVLAGPNSHCDVWLSGRWLTVGQVKMANPRLLIESLAVKHPLPEAWLFASSEMIMQDKPATKDNELQEQELTTWHKPVIMRIELKRTMFGSSSLTDCFQDASTKNCA